MSSIGPMTSKCLDYFMNEIKKENRKDELRHNIIEPCIQFVYTDICEKMYPWFVGVLIFNSVMLIFMVSIFIMVLRNNIRFKK